MQKQADLWKPALITGSIFGFVSGVPFLGAMLNCLCCSLIVGAGVMSSWMVVRGSLEPVTYGRGALAGALSGVVATVVQTVVSLLFGLMIGINPGDQIQQALDQASDLSPEMQRAAEVVASIGLVSLMVIGVLFSMVVYTAFGALGGVIGRAIFEKRPTAPPEGMPPAPMPPGGVTP